LETGQATFIELVQLDDAAKSLEKYSMVRRLGENSRKGS
jgi:hypothetical protein